MNTTPHPDYQPRTLLPCRAVLFDCDGVLVNSEEIIFNSWSRWAQQVGVNPDEVLASIHGRRSQDTVAAVIEPARRSPAPLSCSTQFPRDAKQSSPPGPARWLPRASTRQGSRHQTSSSPVKTSPTANRTRRATSPLPSVSVSIRATASSSKMRFPAFRRRAPRTFDLSSELAIRTWVRTSPTSSSPI